MNERFQKAIALIDAENSKDPNFDVSEGERVPKELLYSRRLTEWVLKLDSNASEALQLAARSQHICRWKIPRSQYPATRVGYHQWKNDLKRFHAEATGVILREAGYDATLIERVRALNLKAGFPEDEESRTLEDALCLMFLEFQFAELSEKTEAEKVVNALQKSWKKMTEKAREAALKLSYNEKQKALLERAFEAHQARS